jgi:chromate reductase, NAD(P)H dehydrogenase (quinone)
MSTPGLANRMNKLAAQQEERVMNKFEIAVIVGSLRRDSINRKLATVIAGLGPADFSFQQIQIDDLPLYNQDDDAHPCAAIKRLKAEILGAHGLLFVTPEYNRSIPGVLKNVIDHASRPFGESVWAGKPAGVVGISMGAMGTSMAQQHLRNILACLDMPTLGIPEVFFQATKGFFDSLKHPDESNRKFLQQWVDHYVDWVKRHSLQ